MSKVGIARSMHLSIKSIWFMRNVCDKHCFASPSTDLQGATPQNLLLLALAAEIRDAGLARRAGELRAHIVDAGE